MPCSRPPRGPGLPEGPLPPRRSASRRRRRDDHRDRTWTYNGRVPGPTIHAVEGDRIRIDLINATDHPHTIHFYGFHSARMDGIPGAGEAMPGETFTYDFIVWAIGGSMGPGSSSGAAALGFAGGLVAMYATGLLA